MVAYRRLLATASLLGLVFVVSCSTGSAPPSSNSGQATAPTTASTAAPTAAVATAAPQATTTPTLGAVPSASTQATVPTTVPLASPATAQAKPTAARVITTVASKPGTFGQADLDKIFPPGKGQDLVFRACVNCHNWVPLVMAGFDKPAWQQNKMNHRNRVSGLSDQEFEFLYDYLANSLPAGHPVPDNIPEDLLSQWTSY